MSGKRQNGNVFKGNAIRKNNRQKKSYVSCDEKAGEVYGCMVRNDGEYISAKIASQEEEVYCYIPGKYRGRVWFKPGDYVVLCAEHKDNIREIKGRVLRRDEKLVKEIFSDSGSIMYFGQNDSEEDTTNNGGDNVYFGINDGEEGEEETDNMGYVVSTKNSYQDDLDNLFAQYEEDNNDDDFIDDI